MSAGYAAEKGCEMSKSVLIRMADDTVAKIDKLSNVAGTTRSEMVRCLCKAGIVSILKTKRLIVSEDFVITFTKEIE